ncbi:15-hydroxyprostaglandin dehydrogenase [NAD(+)]-like [Neocloeon triangulifer]|uniref:15-hydroxyprostaglandin dehydrogenase [NAD(+)]-like n=1 Tax=Neocloeon triangulifer TaxID=2078957 RepID=UPI00286F041D|nr:15-hydroxyprostaglandin dehydrogenase [NAD(+)]-like [Neocloeon triangulifer]
MDLRGKVALITGGAAGIGKACVEELLKLGCKVSICDVNSSNGDTLAQELGQKFNKSVIFCPCDVTDYPQSEEAFQETTSALGPIDIVVNNAGIMNDRFWELEVDTNLNGVIRGTLLGMRFMGKDRGGKGGTIVNVGSNTSMRPYVSAPIYSATKHAVLGFTRSFGDPFHVEQTGVRVVALCPGATSTGIISDIRKQLLHASFEPAWQRDTANSIYQKPDHVARALVTVLQRAVSGSVWMVEGGQPPYEINFANP